MLWFVYKRKYIHESTPVIDICTHWWITRTRVEPIWLNPFWNCKNKNNRYLPLYLKTLKKLSINYNNGWLNLFVLPYSRVVLVFFQFSIYIFNQIECSDWLRTRARNLTEVLFRWGYVYSFSVVQLNNITKTQRNKL